MKALLGDDTSEQARAGILTNVCSTVVIVVHEVLDQVGFLLESSLPAFPEFLDKLEQIIAIFNLPKLWQIVEFQEVSWTPIPMSLAVGRHQDSRGELCHLLSLLKQFL